VTVAIAIVVALIGVAVATHCWRSSTALIRLLEASMERPEPPEVAE
jgi:anthranilate phosphoribosyltransferase